MSNRIELQLTVPPSANRWWRRAGNRMHLSNEAREYKQYVADRCLALRVQCIEAPTPIKVRIIWWRGRKAGDLDKRLGVVLDALQSSCYTNDSQIVALEAYRYEATAIQPPGLVITVEAAA